MRTIFLFILLLLALIIGLVLVLDRLEKNSPLPRDVTISLEEEKKVSDKSLNFFEKEDREDEYQVKYGWKDFSRDPFSISFSINKKELSEAENEFGYYPDKLQEYLNKVSEKMSIEMIVYLRDFTREQIAKTKYSQYILIEDINAKTFTLRLSVPAPLHKEVKREFDKIKEKLAKEQTKYLKKIDKEVRKEWEMYLEERGLRFIQDKIGIMYESCVAKNRPRVRHVAGLMRNLKSSISLREYLEIVVAFIQEIRYGIPPFEENKKVILEFWIPPKVLVNNFGDCDSKVITFASLWADYKRYPVLLVKIPNHMFVGLAIPSTGRGTIIINGLRYTLCEVTGPEKIPPGMIGRYSQICLQNGQFVYEMVN